MIIIFQKLIFAFFVLPANFSPTHNSLLLTMKNISHNSVPLNNTARNFEINIPLVE